MNEQTPAAPAESVQTSSPSPEPRADAFASQAEMSAESATPVTANVTKTESIVATAVPVNPPATAQIPDLATLNESARTSDAASAVPEQTATSTASNDAPLPATNEASSPRPGDPKVHPQAAETSTTNAANQPAARSTTRWRSASVLQRREVLSADALPQTARDARPQVPANETGERGVTAAASQTPTAVEPTTASSREERPLAAAEHAAAPKAAPARVEVQPTPETAQRLLERAIASQQPAEAGRTRDTAPVEQSRTNESQATAGQPGPDQQTSTGGEHSGEQSRQNWTSATPIDRATSRIRRAADTREAPEAAAPSSASATSRPVTIVHTAAPAMLPPQLPEAVATVTSTSSAAATLASDTADRIVQSMRMQYQRGGGDAVLQIRPDHLGPVTISLRVENGVVSAVVSADHPAAAEWLQSNQQSLKESLQQSGLHLERFVVQRDGQSPSDRQRREWLDARRRDLRRRAPQQDSTFEITI
jgi:flagellar hook-length control protein FliK